MRQETYRRIISGQKQGRAVSALRGALRILSWGYAAVIGLRNAAYTAGILPSYKPPVPVISIGNITAGGTGKTPLVIWLCGYLQDKGVRCGILTRGYKTPPGQITDEPALLAKHCPDSTVVVNSNRVAGAKKAVLLQSAKLLIMDDGFQHRRLRRDMDIVVVDATCPFGYDKILPAGLLREPKGALTRASAVVITRADQVQPAELEQLEKEIRCYAPAVPVAATIHTFTGAVTYANRLIALETLRAMPVYAFCGIGNPDAFFDMLKKHSIHAAGTDVFDDHHLYTVEDMEGIAERAAVCGAKAILCTQKDWVKSALLLPEKEGMIFGYMAMELDFIEGLDKITELTDKLIQSHQD